METSIGITPKTKQTLTDLKIHPRETYDQVIQRLIKNRKQSIGTTEEDTDEL